MLFVRLMTTSHGGDIALAAERLAGLYEESFGGKPRGRFRISMKHLRALTGRRRLYPEQIAALGRALYELGYVLVDLESFFVVLSQRTFASCRRVNETSIDAPAGDNGEPSPRRVKYGGRGPTGGRVGV
jgi:hypothetical protein